ncbi:MAG: hypothetical protein LOY00_14620, partial [Methylocaldum sp.]|nr:hypothetical protein [Methylocaldum sp.]
DGANPTSPVLSGTPRFFGPITATLFNPGEDEPVSASALSFDAGYFDQVGSTQITYLDINNRQIGSAQNGGTGIVRFTAPEGTHSFTISGTTDDVGFAIDNLSYTLDAADLSIASPAEGDQFSLNQQNHTRSSDLSFSAEGSGAQGELSWTISLEYDTDRPRGLEGLETAFTTKGTDPKSFYYDSRGAARKSLWVRRTPRLVPWNTSMPWVTRSRRARITARLTRLYANGPTPNLLTGIADKESTYRQFSSRTKYEVQALWPVESYDGGSHIGLMQTPTSVSHAWNWLSNTQGAADLFAEKTRIALVLERRIINSHPGLRALTIAERENMALVLYGPYAAAGLQNQYYRAVQNPDGSYGWVVNTANNPAGVAYANDVRSRVR